MTRFFYYYNSICSGSDSYNVFSYDPYIISMKGLLLSELQKIVFYIEKLKDLKIDMSDYTDKVIDFISIIIINLDFKKESLFIIIQDLQDNKKKLKETYINTCKELQIEYNLLPNDNEEFTSEDDILRVLNEYEKNLRNKTVHINENKRVFYEIIINLVLNACNYLIELKHFNSDFPKAKNKVLNLLNCFNIPSLDEPELKKIIEEFSICNYQIMKLLHEKNVENFGPITKTKVPLFQKKGKAILVANSSYFELEKLLNFAQKYSVDVYANFSMLPAFQYKKLNSYSNFVGCYNTIDNNILMDFSSFSGPIFVSKNALLKTEVTRGQIYTTAKYPSYGIAKIENDNFYPIIQYALNSNGFENSTKEKFIEIGYNDADIKNILDEIVTKYNKKEINRIFIIGLSNALNKDNDYVKTFINKASSDDYIISFAYNSERDNFCYLNPNYNFSLLYQIIENLFDSLDNVQEKLAVFIVDCSQRTLSQLFNLIHLKVKNIFLGTCCPNVLNPVLQDGLSKFFNIKKLSQPLTDIEKIK
ncbi:hypothetical protein IJD44_10370 [bacterium]|nr:hypothetical protein [bacterium]